MSTPRLHLTCCLCRKPIPQNADVYALDHEWQRRYPADGRHSGVRHVRDGQHLLLQVPRHTRRRVRARPPAGRTRRS
ncbi:hypothetical protein L083_1638 [Actinoplanes sp. N902-109]|nr:hypothetical protein L083_1638 [Actinoplanes sp. N902-109]